MAGAPWNDQNVKENLQVLSRVRPGNKLYLYDKGEILDVLIIKKGASLLSKKSVGTPDELSFTLIALFTKARDLYQTRSAEYIRKRDITDAQNGVQRLRRTYNKAGLWQTALDQTLIAIAGIIAGNGLQQGVTRATGLVDLRGHGTKDLLQIPELRGLKQSIFGWLDATGNDGLTEEYPLPTPVVKGIYGTGKQGNTRIPTMPGRSYRRRNSGICEAARLDWEREGINIDGELMRFVRRDEFPGSQTARLEFVDQMKRLYDCTGKDDALFFTASQILSQAGLGALGMFLFAFKYAKNEKAGKQKVVFHRRNHRFSIMRFVPSYHISTTNGLQVAAELRADANTTIFLYDMQQNMIMPEGEGLYTLEHLHMDDVVLRIAINLKRKGPTVVWDVAEASLTYSELILTI